MSANKLQIDFDLLSSNELQLIADKIESNWQTALGHLIGVWRWFCSETTDGRWRRSTPEQAFDAIDELARRPGIGRAMNSVGWLDVEPSGLVSIPNFDRLMAATRRREQQTTRQAARRMRRRGLVPGERCRACGESDDLTVDHIIPVSRGGTNDPSNLQLLCRPCNSSKGARQ